MNKTLCCFPIESKARDFDSRLYQSLICIKHNRNFSALIGKKGKVNVGMFKFNLPFLYFTKGTNNHPNSLNFLLKIHQNNGKLIYLDEEGGPSKKDETLLMLRYTREVLSYVNLICAWGENQKNIILKNSPGFSEKKISVTGHPRFDIKKKKFESYFQALRDGRQKDFDRYILFNLNFGFSNSHLSKEQMLTLRFEDYQIRFPNKFKKEKLERLYDYQQKLRESYISSIKAIAKKYSVLQIVVRPHPSENKNTYMDEFINFKNIHVIQEGSVQEWIIDAELIIHHDCTTAIEAFFYGKIPVSYDPLGYNEEINSTFINHLPIEISITVSSENELIELIGKNKKGIVFENYVTVLNEKKEKLKKYFANIDFSSAEKIALEVEKISSLPDIDLPQINCNLDILKKESYFSKLKLGLFHILLKRITDRFKPKNTSNEILSPEIERKNMLDRFKTKFSGLSFDEIKTRINLFRKIDLDIPLIELIKVEDDLFYLKAKAI